MYKRNIKRQGTTPTATRSKVGEHRVDATISATEYVATIRAIQSELSTKFVVARSVFCADNSIAKLSYCPEQENVYLEFTDPEYALFFTLSTGITVSG